MLRFRFLIKPTPKNKNVIVNRPRYMTRVSIGIYYFQKKSQKYKPSTQYYTWVIR